ncbi:chemotaxis protein CheB [Phytopseudomonas dryadis]|uniref:protein-glutamate methylesterase n=1 Tax=Phytopseudomonas dryadis TaxID=2487520 RepID=A0A4Q9R874_9GAMM|nr:MULTISPECIES: chemotaxis protein CheB [Pseudomonas]TBU96237.1 chemotaxis protein CheB [Pseudomonas dryadis]TBV02890.1 chemotaxis protein CheB [Pseudomonas dryadis]TBV15958.1 chemotaxis protein CheB [Pseudomonas sp. FRB 230]
MSARIAVIADTSLQRHVLQQALTSNGYQVVLNSDPARLDEAALEACEANLWLVDLAQSDDVPLIDALLASASAPVLFGEGHAPERHSENYPRWERRLVGKLKKLVGDPSQAVGPSLDGLLAEAQRPGRIELPEVLANTPLVAGEPARQVWLLAASLGGPEAVKAFLDALPGGLPVGFLYAQHIDPAFEAVLPQAIGRHSQWRVNQARDGDAVRCGEVIVVPISRELAFSDAGAMQISARPWPEPYSPSIDQMMLNLAQRYAECSGVIVFSGMGSDGSAAAAYVRRQGGVIWTQRADSCVCSSMPDSLREGGYSSFSADPRELAVALVEHLAGQCR